MTRDEARKQLRALAICLAGGCSVFVLLLFAFLTVIQWFAPMTLDPSVLLFYPVAAILGLVFGLERWLSYLQGPYNPFHDR